MRLSLKTRDLQRAARKLTEMEDRLSGKPRNHLGAREVRGGLRREVEHRVCVEERLAVGENPTRHARTVRDAAAFEQFAPAPDGAHDAALARLQGDARQRARVEGDDRREALDEDGLPLLVRLARGLG